MALFPQPFIDEVRAAADIVTVDLGLRVAAEGGRRATRASVRFTARRRRRSASTAIAGSFTASAAASAATSSSSSSCRRRSGFADAVRQLAQRFGIPIPELEATRGGPRERAPSAKRCCEMHEIAAAYFREQLDSAGAAARIREYLPGAREPDAGDDRRRSASAMRRRRATACASGC